MPKYEVNTDRTEEASSSLQSDFEEFKERMADIKSKVDGLISDGYSTPAAEEKFRPFFEDFSDGFEQVNEGLEGISKYVKQVGDTFSSTDEELGSGLK